MLWVERLVLGAWLESNRVLQSLQAVQTKVQVLPDVYLCVATHLPQHHHSRMTWALLDEF
jgi:hypothetical protein